VCLDVRHGQPGSWKFLARAVMASSSSVRLGRKEAKFNITVIHEKGTDPKTRWTAGCGARCPISGEKIMSVVQKFFLPVSKSTMYSTRRMLVGPGKVASYSISNLDIL
jgi:hypothetical protein